MGVQVVKAGTESEPRRAGSVQCVETLRWGCSGTAEITRKGRPPQIKEPNVGETWGGTGAPGCGRREPGLAACSRRFPTQHIAGITCATKKHSATARMERGRAPHKLNMAEISVRVAGRYSLD